MPAEQRLQQSGIDLPPAPRPAGNYVPAVEDHGLLWVSGHGPLRADGTLITGVVGTDLDLEEAYAAARQAGLGILATLRERLGSLDRVERVIKVLGFVRASRDFTAHPRVVNGCSDLFVEVFGEEAGRAARSALGMGSLPDGIAVEVEAVFRLRG